MKSSPSEASSIPHSIRLPAHVLEEDTDEFQIIINTGRAPKSDLQIYVSEDGSRMHVIGEKFYRDSIDRFLWTFHLPKTGEWRTIVVCQKNDFFLIRVPKKKFWGRAEMVFRRSSEQAAHP